jgi:hypothetical protein
LQGGEPCRGEEQRRGRLGRTNSEVATAALKKCRSCPIYGPVLARAVTGRGRGARWAGALAGRGRSLGGGQGPNASHKVTRQTHDAAT